MIKKVFGSGYTVTCLWVVFLGYGLYLFNFGSYPRIKALANGMALPEELFGASLDYQRMFLEEIGRSGADLYRSFQWLDFINAFLLGLVLSSTIYLMFTRLNVPRAGFALVFLPLATAVFDFVENAFMIANLGYLPELDSGLASTFSAMTRAKLVFGTLSFLILIITIVAMAVSFITKRFKK